MRFAELYNKIFSKCWNINFTPLSIHSTIWIPMMLDAVSIPFHQWKSHRLTRHSRSFREFYRHYIGLPVCARRDIYMKLLTSSRAREQRHRKTYIRYRVSSLPDFRPTARTVKVSQNHCVHTVEQKPKVLSSD